MSLLRAVPRAAAAAAAVLVICCCCYCTPLASALFSGFRVWCVVSVPIPKSESVCKGAPSMRGRFQRSSI